jgi:hypothetical protein
VLSSDTRGRALHAVATGTEALFAGFLNVVSRGVSYLAVKSTSLLCKIDVLMCSL